MKIAFYINAIHEGGAERVMVNLASKFSDMGEEILLITSFRDKWEYPYSDKICRYNLENENSYNSRIIRNISRIKKLRTILKHEQPDCIISFMAEPNYRAIIASCNLNIKTIISVRNDPNREYAGIMGKFLGKVLLPIADGCIFQTSDAKMWFPTKLQKKSVIIYNAVKEDFFQVERHREKKLIISCGRLEKQKNHKLLIDAFEIVHKKDEEAHLNIYGEGSLHNVLENYLRDKKLEGCISLKGNSKDVPTVLQSAALFVLSSDFEGMPNALMEAMAAGVPCVSTDCPCGGPRQLIEDNVSGYLVPVNDKERLAEAMMKFLKNEEKAEAIGRMGKNKAYEFFPDKIYEKWYQYIRHVVNL